MNVELETGAASRFPPSPSVSSELGAIVSYRVVYKCIFDIVFFIHQLISIYGVLMDL